MPCYVPAAVFLAPYRLAAAALPLFAYVHAAVANGLQILVVYIAFAQAIGAHNYLVGLFVFLPLHVLPRKLFRLPHLPRHRAATAQQRKQGK